MGLLLQKKVEIDGATYTLQRIPLKAYLELNDRCTNKNGVLMKAQYSEELLKHCVISPHVTLATFDDNPPAGMELVGEIESFLTAKADKSGGKEESE
jgi:hypothetical protein